jgi:hypothetical protein
MDDVCRGNYRNWHDIRDKVWIGIESTARVSEKLLTATLGMLLAGSVCMSSARAEACAWNLLEHVAKLENFMQQGAMRGIGSHWRGCFSCQIFKLNMLLILASLLTDRDGIGMNFLSMVDPSWKIVDSRALGSGFNIQEQF